ncbi:hypothetical protein [Bosea psychrotolerans]|uniref:Uncharacterized protein n=1 Tax=Bosea psychrotolerans TaxID=1871628 RepID=A0A2S4MCT5_9HYPH|nr:hypothetical protein [Bosea psychrotolerans]POR52568.1 hypothetical protein CYD53_105233 [Bosea psychrotolerans]
MDEVDELRSRLSHDDRLPAVPRSGKRMEWRYKAYDDLLQRLGHSDGMAEVIEVARRDFIDGAYASGDPRGYLIERARAQKIVVHELDTEKLPARAAVLYVVGAYQQLDGFLKDLIREIDQVCHRTSRERSDKEAPIDWALDVLPGGKLRNTRRIWQERYLVLEYYRVVRNAFTHKVKLSSVEAALCKAREWSPIYKADFGLDVPNAPDRLTIDDFLLFTRVIKYVATDLCRIGRPTRAEIEAHAIREIASGRKLRALDWHTIGRGKAGAKILDFYQQEFHFDLNSELNLLDDIINNKFKSIERC